jgi:hypothetical protein
VKTRIVVTLSTAMGGTDSRRHERALADFWTSYRDSHARGVRFFARHSLLVWQAARAAHVLPEVEARPSGSPGGRAVAATVAARGPLGTPARLFGTAALRIPADPGEHLDGSGAKTLRRKIRSAENAGVRWRSVTGPDERRRLLEAANEAERSHPDPQYAVAVPANDDLLQHALWLVAEDRDGTPLVLSVTPVDGHLATLRYFRTLGRSAVHSDSRYLMTHALVAELSRRGVRWLLDTEAPGAQTNGLRHFQRMVGFRYVRVRLQRA